MTLSKRSILVIDDEQFVLDSFEMIFKETYVLYLANTAQRGLEIVRNKEVDVVFLDLDLPDLDGFSVLKEIKTFDSSIEVVMVTADKEARSAVRAMKDGALDYITKPFNIDEVELIASKAVKDRLKDKELTRLRSLADETSFFDIVGDSQAINKVKESIQKSSRVECTVLVTGETGTGKELVARALHKSSANAEEPFICVHCGAIPESLIESELFGHEKGAFTGATEKKLGKFELAGNGTIFLDEISTMPYHLQAKLLRVLQEHEIERVGGNRVLPVPARVVAATNVDLQDMIKKKMFREDLYHRLNVMQINVPPLRERIEDISLLAEHFLLDLRKRLNTQVKVSGYTDEVIELFKGYHWPGNVRELRNMIERLVLLSEKDTIEASDLSFDLFFAGEGQESDQDKDARFSFKKERARYERDIILQVLKEAEYNQTKAAKLLNVHRNTLMLKLKQFDIDAAAMKKEYRKNL